MRSAFLVRWPFLLLFVALAHCQPPPQTVNPHTQIRWPANCNNHPGMVYNYVTNTCIIAPDASNVVPGPPTLCANGPNGALTTTGCTIPAPQVTWPGTCTSGVYSPASNTCVPPGTAANPAGANGEIQLNLGGIFSSIPGSQPMGTNNNGMSVTGPLQSPTVYGTTLVSTPAAIGYKQNAGTPSLPSRAAMHNRDQTTGITVTPQDFCPNAGNGITSDSKCFWEAMRWLANTSTASPKQLIVPWTPQGYFFSNTDYCCLATLPYDFGDYHGSAGYATPAQVNVYFGNGYLVGCNITGGSGYTPNAKLPIQVLDPNHAGSGAAAYVQTNANGIPGATCTIQQPGINYPNTGVYANVLPLGGDGAAGTATLSGGTFTAPTVTTGGYGYSTTPLPQVMVTGLACTTYPVFAATVNAAAQISAVTITTAGTACTLAGNNSPGALPLVFGASCGGVQCTLMDPEPVINMPISIPYMSGVQIVGVGNPLLSGECSITTNGCGSNNSAGYSPGAPVNGIIPEAALIGDPWGDQTGVFRDDLNQVVPTTLMSNWAGGNRFLPLPVISGLTLGGDFDFWFPMLAGGTFTDLTLQSGIGFYIGTVQGNLSQTLDFQNDTFKGVAGMVIGGDWTARNPGTSNIGRLMGYSGGSRGGTIMGHFNKNTLLSTSWNYGGIGSMSLENPTFLAIAGYDLQFDKWIEQYLWKSQNGPASPYTDSTHLLSNGGTSCLNPNSLVNAGRATDSAFGYSSSFALFQEPWWDYPWFNCFRGVRGSLVMAQPRYSYVTSTITVYPVPVNDSYSIRMVNYRGQGASRPIFEGQPQYADFKSILNIPPGAFTGDPYWPGTLPVTSLWLLSSGYPASNTNVYNNGVIAGTIEDVNQGIGGNTHGLQVLYFGVSTPVQQSQGNVTLSRLNIRNVQSLTDRTTSQSVINAGTQALTNQANTLVMTSNMSLNAGTYRASEYGWTTAPQTGGVMSLCLYWFDGNTSTAATCPVSAQPASTLTRYSFEQVFHSALGGTFNIQNTCNGNAAQACSFDWVLERLQ